jgi:hypothetical protein
LLQLLTKTCSNIDLSNIYDINFVTDSPFKFEINSINIYDFWYKGENKHDDNVNKYIPNIKHLEYLEQKYINFVIALFNKVCDKNFAEYMQDNKIKPEQILSILGKNLDTNYIKFYNRFIQVFANLEKYEINFNRKKIHSNYNLYNTYSRPTNVSGKINFTALSKKDESLKKFVPNNTIFVEYDYTSYQIHLLYDLLDVKHSTDVYQDLCKLYKNDDRDFVKKQSMYYMFGEIDVNPFPNNEFFTKLFQLKNLIKNMEEFISPISGKTIKLKQDSGDISKILQILETEKNVTVLENIETYLNKKLTKMVLYKYDAFLFDFDENDGIDTLHDLQNIIEQNGTCSVKFGYNYFEICN